MIRYCKNGDFLVILRLQNQKLTMKKILIACYLVLCVYFSFAQEGEVVLEIPIKLESSMWNTTPWTSNLIANEDKSRYALLLGDYKDFHLFLLNQNFQNDKEISLINKNRDFKREGYHILLGVSLLKNKCHFVLADNYKERFKIFILDTETEEMQSFNIPLYLGRDRGLGEDYIQSFQIGEKYYFMTIIHNQPIINFFVIDINKKIEKLTFDLSKDFSKKQLGEALNLSKKEVIKVEEQAYMDLETGVANNRLYLQGGKVVMSVANASKVLTFDLASKTHTVKHYKLLFLNTFEEDAQKNMLIYKDKIYQVAGSSFGLTLNIKTLQDSLLYKYRLQEPPDTKNIPFKYDSFQKVDNKHEITQEKTMTTGLFLNNIGQLNKRSGISFLINELDSGQIQLIIGSTKIITEVQGGMVQGNMGMGGAPNMMMIGGRDAGYQSIFFDALFDEKSGQPIKKNIDNAYTKFRAKVALRKASPNTHAITTIKTKDGYLLGYYDTNTEKKTKPEKYVFVFFKNSNK